MSYEIGVLDSDRRARDKQAGRDRDAARLASGKISREEIAKQNGFFSSLPIRDFKIVSICSRPFGPERRD